MSAPPIVWIDERIARGLPQDKDPELAERGINQIRYVNQARVNDLVQAAIGPDELLVQLNVTGAGVLYGLSNYGRVFCFLQGDVDKSPRWELVAEGLPA